VTPLIVQGDERFYVVWRFGSCAQLAISAQSANQRVQKAWGS
jgi:hypothetical protein